MPGKNARYAGFTYCGAVVFREVLWLEQQHVWYWLHITPCRWVRGKQVLETAMSAVERYLQRLEPVWVVALLEGLLPEDRTALLYRLTLKGAAGVLVRLCGDEQTRLLTLLDSTTRSRVKYEMKQWPTEFYFPLRDGV